MAARIKVLVQEQADLARDLRAVSDKATAEARELNDEEKASRTKAFARLDDLKGEISAEQQIQDLERTLAASGDRNRPLDTDQQEREQRREESRGTPAAGFQGPDAFGQLLHATYVASQPDGHIDRRLMAAASGLNESVGSEGGFLVQQEQSTQIRDRIYKEDPLLSRVTRIPLGAKSNGTKLLGVDETSLANGQIYGGITSYWTAEAGTKQASTPKFREMDLKLKKVAALLYVTDELLEDTTALEAWARSRVPLALRRKAARAIYNGTGAGMPKGFLNSGAAIDVSADAGQAAGTVSWSNILNMWTRMHPDSRANAVWLVDSTVEFALYQMYLPVGQSGVPVFLPANIAAGQLYPTLLGRPVIPVEFNQQLGTRGDIVLVDPSAYLWIDKGDVQTASSIHVRFINDETCFRFVWRVDGQLEWNSVLTPDNGGPTQSPVVVLSTRA